MHSWSLPSNNGWNIATWSVRDILRVDDEPYLLVEVRLTGRFWKRAREVQSSFAGLNMTKEYSVILPQVLLSEERLKKLCHQLSKWLRTPINELAARPLRVKARLGVAHSHAFTIKFGSRRDRIIGPGQTACAISYEVNALAGECVYLVDPSCIQQFVDELSRYFSEP